jgi:two-component system cell cycle sensor histidine kinase/response regulator CckA
MEQVVLNLAVNARDAMPEGGEMTFAIHTLDVGAEDCKSRPGAEPGRYVVLSVTDTGCGIPEAMRGRVFEPFFTTKPHGKGTGMGLAMVYGIVKDHGGWVEVDSEPGRGTTFRVFLPVAKAPADDDLRAPPDAGRILVVDDEELVRNVVVRMLSGVGYEVATAADAREAVEYYRRFSRDVSVVIIDMVMPKMDGLGCFAALRGLDPDVKALLATGCENENRVQAALDQGMAGLVRKPFQTKQLAKAVKQALTH